MVVNAKWNFKSDVKDVGVEYVVRDMQVACVEGRLIVNM